MDAVTAAWQLSCSSAGADFLDIQLGSSSAALPHQTLISALPCRMPSQWAPGATSTCGTWQRRLRLSSITARRQGRARSSCCPWSRTLCPTTCRTMQVQGSGVSCGVLCGSASAPGKTWLKLAEAEAQVLAIVEDLQWSCNCPGALKSKTQQISRAARILHCRVAVLTAAEAVLRL